MIFKENIDHYFSPTVLSIHIKNTTKTSLEKLNKSCSKKARWTSR